MAVLRRPKAFKAALLERCADLSRTDRIVGKEDRDAVVHSLPPSSEPCAGNSPPSRGGRLHAFRLDYRGRLWRAQKIDQRLRCFDILCAIHDCRGKNGGILQITR